MSDDTPSSVTLRYAGSRLKKFLEGQQNQTASSLSLHYEVIFRLRNPELSFAALLVFPGRNRMPFAKSYHSKSSCVT
jgi:hypothetical protein